jgi:hypothetical protein
MYVSAVVTWAASREGEFAWTTTTLAMKTSVRMASVVMAIVGIRFLMVAPPSLVVNDLEISIKYFPIKVNIFVIITLNITIYLPPGPQRAPVDRQAVAVSELAFLSINLSLRRPKKTLIA